MSAVGRAVLLLADRKNISHARYETHLAVKCLPNGIALLQESDNPSGQQYRYSGQYWVLCRKPKHRDSGV
jgi:hypothetical protein